MEGENSYKLDIDLDGKAVDRNPHKQVPKQSGPVAGSLDTIEIPPDRIHHKLEDTTSPDYPKSTGLADMTKSRQFCRAT
jgi:hypothetical protein